MQKYVKQTNALLYVFLRKCRSDRKNEEREGRRAKKVISPHSFFKKEGGSGRTE
jgi:hypothetical protein